MTLNVVIVRHGQTDHNLQGIIQGHFDAPLNKTGRYQAKLAGRALSDIRFDAAFTSDSSRAKVTAEAIMDEQTVWIGSEKTAVLAEHVELRERDMGELSNTKGPVPRPLPASVEPSAVFMKRLADWFKQTILPLKDEPEDRTVLIVSHGAAILTLFREFVTPASHGGFGYSLAPGIEELRHCSNTSMSTLRIERDGTGVITGFDEHGHLTVGRELKGPDDAVDHPAVLKHITSKPHTGVSPLDWD